MSNLHLFELINAGPGLDGWQLLLTRGVAEHLIQVLALVMIWAWVRGNHASRRELLQMLLAAMLGLALAQLVALVWPQPRPFALHLGHQYLAHSDDAGLPSDQVTVFWSLALAALVTRRFELWALPLLACGLLVGWSRVFLGLHFPYDVLAAFPVAALALVIAQGLRRPMLPAVARLLYLYDGLARWVRDLLLPGH